MTLFEWLIIAAGVFLTVLIEGAVFMTSAEYRNKRFIAWIVFVNVTSNILLNLSFYLMDCDLPLLSYPVILGEAIVWAAECVAYCLRFGYSRKLVLYTCLANAVTFAVSFLFELTEC